MRRLALAATIVLALGAFTALPRAQASVARPVADSVAAATGSGLEAVGAPGEDVGGIVDAGAVSVLSSASGWQLFSQNSAAGATAERNDHFGAALAQADFNNDGFTDLAISAPGEDVGAVVDAGAVNVLYGSANGVTGSGSQTFTQNSPGVASSAERGDLFGYALAAADFDNDGYADLAIGVRRESGSRVESGAVNVLHGSAAGLTGSGSQLFTQNNIGTGNRAQPAELFGSALAAGDFDTDGFADLAVGVPHHDDFGVSNAGAVYVIRGSASGLTGIGGQLFTEDSPGVPGTTEVGDAFGSALATGDFGNDGFADLAVGVPAEDVMAARNAGAAYVLHGSAAGLTGTGSRGYTQNSTNWGDKAERGDLFGFSVAAVNMFDVGDELVVGSPGEDVGSAENAGMVHLGGWAIDENTQDMDGTSESGDHFGASVAELPSHPAYLIIGIPGEDHEAGAVMYINGSLDDGDQLPPEGHLWSQKTPNMPDAAEPGDFFGSTLAF